jgi:uncharacterized phage protein (TIGR02220 family)
MTYKIKDWGVHFENNRSRVIEHCSFVCVPNKQHGMGFSRVMAEIDGAAIYGVWHLLVGACSQQTKRDGWMTLDGQQSGTPWSPEDLALKFRRPVKEIVRALTFLSSEKVGWITTYAQSDAQVTTDCNPSDAQVTPKGVEGRKEGTEGMKEIYHVDSRTVLFLLKEATGSQFREVDTNLKFISERLKEHGVTLDGVKRMIARQVKKWKGTDMEQYLRPSTLFNATKFEGYYASKDQPVFEGLDVKNKSNSHHLTNAQKLAASLS